MSNKKKSFGASTPLSDHLSQLYIKQKEEQRDELYYLSGLAFEQFGFEEKDVNEITQRIDKKLGLREPQPPSSLNKQTSFNTALIAVLCGLLIGISVFFIIFNKSKNHASVYQNLVDENKQLKQTLNNYVLSTDTVFNIPQNNNLKPKEHFTSQDELTIVKQIYDELENLEPKKVTVPFSDLELEEVVLPTYIPNAPVLFISNLKIANYKSYYFKQNDVIDLALNTGLSAQFENKSLLQKTQRNRNSKFLAHLIIQRAMKLFSQKQFDASAEELQTLYDFNKQDANVQFYLGMCYFEKQQYSKALVMFDTNIENEINVFHQESVYYRALCLLKTNKKEEAKQVFQQIKTQKGFYADRAGEVLSKW